MDFDPLLLTDRVAVVTGGGAGIGRAIALTFADLGADIVVADIVPERCEEVADRVREKGRRALAAPTDVMSTDQVRAMVEATAATFGRLDILVNNAGGVTRRPFLDQSERSWRRHIDLNLVSCLAAISAATPIMVEGGRGGAILNVSSIEGSRAAPGYAVYAACKAALNNLTRTLALEFAGHGIRVNTLAPDYTDTPGTRGNHKGPVDPSTWIQIPPERAAATARYVPLGRAGLEVECGRAAAFLCSDMGSYVTGVILPVDGGTSASAGWVRSRADGDWKLVET